MFGKLEIAATIPITRDAIIQNQIVAGELKMSRATQLQTSHYFFFFLWHWEIGNCCTKSKLRDQHCTVLITRWNSRATLTTIVHTQLQKLVATVISDRYFIYLAIHSTLTPDTVSHLELESSYGICQAAAAENFIRILSERSLFFFSLTRGHVTCMLLLMAATISDRSPLSAATNQ